jgi:hypothetical protein
VRDLMQFNNRERAALAVCALFIAATLLLTLVDRTSLVHATRLIINPNYLQFRYTGTIVTPDEASGMCRFAKYDNRTSEIRNAEINECNSKSKLDTPHSRLQSLRDTFKK